jgi:transmembrane sensor
MRARSDLKDLAADEAARWAVRLDSDSVSDEERRAFEAWRDRSAENAQRYERAVAAMHVFDEAQHDPNLDALRRAALRYEPERRTLSFKGIAAALVLALVGLVAALALQGELSFLAAAPVASLYEDGAADYSTRRGERLEVTLPDGTAITLNTETDLDVVFDGRYRRVQMLRGQAFFAVAKDPLRPFVVEAGGKQIVAIGTAFDVRLDNDRLEVLLVEGRVAVENVARSDAVATLAALSDARVQLNPGETLVATGSEVVHTPAPNPERQLKWRDGLIEFDNTTLANAVEEFNRYSERAIRIEDPQVAELLISGIFRTNSQRNFLDALTSLHPVAIEYRGPNELALVQRSATQTN